VRYLMTRDRPLARYLTYSCHIYGFWECKVREIIQIHKMNLRITAKIRKKN
jgi:hypothetical protein